MGAGDATFKFQSTLPAWGATADNGGNLAHIIFQSTLPAWGATPPVNRILAVQDISIHAPRMGSDIRRSELTCDHARISIHAPRMGSDVCDRSAVRLNTISIHAPRMGSDYSHSSASRYTRFQSTLPAWGATALRFMILDTEKISIHAPRMGSDSRERRATPCWSQFQSTLPAWGATLRHRESISGG